MPTMKDVARVAEVSLATVSSTLSGAAYVSPELKARVLAAVEALGYAPNSIASGLKKGTTALIGLIVPDITNPFFTEFIHALQRRARQAGFSVLLSDSEGAVEREQSLLRMMRAHLAAGTIICPIGSDEAYEAAGRMAGAMAVVTVDHRIVAQPFDSVLLDNYRAAALATSHILSFGHERIATIAGPQHLVPGRDRLAGFAETCRDAGVRVDAERIRPGFFRQEEAFVACLDLLARPQRPTAIFVANNHMLIGVMRAIAATGLTCPADVSVAAIDDFPWATAFTPALTTVRQPVETMAEATLALLQRRMAAPDAAPRHDVFEPELVIRQSCAAPVTPRRMSKIGNAAR